MPVNKKGAAESTLQQTLLKTANASGKATPSMPSSQTEPGADSENAKIMKLLENLAADQKKILDDQKKHFADIQSQLLETKRSISAVEGKLSDMIPRLNSAEARLDALEETERQRCDSPLATTTDIEMLNAKLAEIEDRERRCNLRIYGFPEKVENTDVTSFLRRVLPEILQCEFEHGLEIERAHRALGPVTPGARPRPFVVRFLRFQEKEQVRRLAKERGEVRWKEHKISFYQDFSRATQTRRQAFAECKRLLHQAKIPFGIGYPAVLFFSSPNGSKHRFDDHKKALKFIKEL